MYGLVAPLTAIVGAALGANLALLALDIWWGWAVHERFVDINTAATLESVPAAH
jgi:hypothetical protein